VRFSHDPLGFSGHVKSTGSVTPTAIAASDSPRVVSIEGGFPLDPPFSLCVLIGFSWQFTFLFQIGLATVVA